MRNQILHGKKLPVPFAKGYLRACEDVMGRTVAMAYYEVGASKIVSESSKRKEWLKPLRAYFEYNATLFPLDYAYTSLIVEGMREDLDANKKAAIHCTKSIGYRWWFGLAPAAPVDDDTSLRFLFSSDIIKQLSLLKHATSKYRESQEIQKRGVLAFTDVLRKKGNISCGVSAENNDIQIHIDTCPFCLGHSEICHVFLGVYESLLDWMNGGNQYRWSYPTYRVESVPTDSHTLLLTRSRKDPDETHPIMNV